MVPIQFTGHQVELTQILRDFTTKKFERLQKHADQITSIHVVFNVNKLLQKAEVKIHIPKKEVYASAESDDMYKTVDMLVDKVVRQLEKRKGKNDDKKRLEA